MGDKDEPKKFSQTAEQIPQKDLEAIRQAGQLMNETIGEYNKTINPRSQEYVILDKSQTLFKDLSKSDTPEKATSVLKKICDFFEKVPKFVSKFLDSLVKGVEKIKDAIKKPLNDISLKIVSSIVKSYVKESRRRFEENEKKRQAQM